MEHHQFRDHGSREPIGFPYISDMSGSYNPSPTISQETRNVKKRLSWLSLKAFQQAPGASDFVLFSTCRRPLEECMENNRNIIYTWVAYG